MLRCNDNEVHISQYSRSRATLDATRDTAIGQVFAPYRLGRRHDQQFWLKKTSCSIVKSLSKASIQKAQNKLSTQLIKATRCIERLYATIKAKDLSKFSSYQTLIADKNPWSY